MQIILQHFQFRFVSCHLTLNIIQRRPYLYAPSEAYISSRFHLTSWDTVGRLILPWLLFPSCHYSSWSRLYTQSHLVLTLTSFRCLLNEDQISAISPFDSIYFPEFIIYPASWFHPHLYQSVLNNLDRMSLP